MIPKDEARDCCVKGNIYGELSEADFDGEYGHLSDKHVYVDALHWESQ
jgi:hypothetical protein